MSEEKRKSQNSKTEKNIKSNVDSRTNKKSNSKSKQKKKGKGGLELFRKGLKDSSGFMWGLFVNLLIAYLIIKLFSLSFNFAYDVFSDTAYKPASDKVVVVNIPADSSALQIGEVREENGIIKNKHVFWAKVKIKGYGPMLKHGKFGLSGAMTYDQIFEEICENNKSTEEDQ